MNNRNATNPGMVIYLLIPLGVAGMSLVIRSGMLRIVGLAGICTWILLRDQLKVAFKERS